ncbi:glutathione S-transferase-like isoform X1 [Hypomesus transpacificus]|uniref:glutathione S-transferase-like isoform X1 n=1 Tax=Hypomesus transpacificus TaxID=137520 RepID=UPI001F07705B|nr:glutathione S-transferase-like isoform X1 [Hypomesus transpacificus]
MAGKVVLHYFNGRGKMESIRWLLAVSGVEFEEVFLTSGEQYEKHISGESTSGQLFTDLLNETFTLLSSYVSADGDLMFGQVPMVEIDGMKLVQTKAILNYIAGKYNLYGKDLKERAMIDMYSEGLRDFMEMIMILCFTPPMELKTKLENIQAKATGRYLPVYEKALCGSQYLVGDQLSCADIHLLEATLMMEEKFPEILKHFPNVEAFQGRMKVLPTIHKFLQPNSMRKPQPDEVYVTTVKKVLNKLFLE